MKNIPDIEQLADRFKRGNISKQEFQQLVEWYTSFDDTKAHIETDEPLEQEQLKNRILNSIVQRVQADEVMTGALAGTVRKKNLWLWRAAAILLLFIIAGLSFFQYRRSQQAPMHADAQALALPTEQARLRLGDGTVIELRPDSNGLISREEITYAQGGVLVDSESIQEKLQRQPIALETPHGKQFRVVLSDGTQVWLNANSVLRYPHRFAQSAREVEVVGEAFFKVAQKSDANGHRIPFRVRTARQHIEVLGTEFNIHDYPGLSYAHTTLLEGKVAVDQAGQRYTLKPDQQWTVQNGKASVRTVATDSYVAWRHGKFDFNNKTLDQVLDEVSLWYGISVVYPDGVPQVELTGDAYRDDDFKLILRLLDVAKVSYTLDIPNRKLIIKK